jgi:competence protein ComEC
VCAPALLVALPLLSGAAAAILGFQRLPPDFGFVTGGAAALLWLAAVAAFLLDDAGDATTLVVAGAIAVGLSLGTSDAARVYRSSLAGWFERVAPGAPVVVEGVLREDAVPSASGVSLTVDVNGIGELGKSELVPVEGGVRLSIAGTLLDARVKGWRAGRTVRMPALLRELSTYFNPGTPDERPALARRGITLVGTVKSATVVELMRRGSAWREAAAGIRAWTRRQIERVLAPVDATAAGVTSAVLIGDRSGLRPQDERRLQEAGTYHVIAISGGNIAVLAVVLTACWRLVLLPTRWASLVTAALLLFYGAVAGGAASVARAVTVAVLVLAARSLDHRAQTLDVLAVAALLAVAATPVVVLDAGFLLSFGATAGILLGVPLLAPSSTAPRHRVSAARRAGGVARTMLAATVCAELALAPVAATLFGRVSFAGFVLNFAAIPLMSVVQIGGLVLAASAETIAPLALLAARTVHGAASALLASAALVDVAPWLVVDAPPPEWWLTAAYYAALAGLLARRATRYWAVCFTLAAALLLAGPRLTARDAVPRSRLPLRVVVLDVGQGDATLVSLPGGTTMLVDTGGLAPLSTGVDGTEPPAFDVGERVAVPALRALGVTRLESVVITHGDPDHLSGAFGIVRHLPPHSVWDGVPVPPHAGLQRLAAWAIERGVSWRRVQAGDVERFGAVELRVLHPPPPDWERQRVRNEDSVVVELRLGSVSVVLPGDIGREGEHALLPRLEPGRLVVLKAPHHGSATSSTAELLDVLRPAAVIFSAGRNNRFGHPHPAVVERYRAIGSQIFSTAEDGAVFVETDGSGVEIWGYHSGTQFGRTTATQLGRWTARDR